MGSKEGANAVASQPESPLKETTDTGDDKYHSAPEVLTEVKGRQYLFFFKLYSRITYKTSGNWKISSVGWEHIHHQAPGFDSVKTTGLALA